MSGHAAIDFGPPALMAIGTVVLIIIMGEKKLFPIAKRGAR